MSPALRRVRVLINPKSGLGLSVGGLLKALEEAWDVPGCQLTYQVSRSADDGREKAARAVAEGVDTILVVGGDGMVNSIGAALVGTPVKLGVIPTGSGNGFARHFGIPLDPERAARVLARADPARIDVGEMNGRPFFVTCSLAWDAALVKSFEKFPVRGILPYVLAGAIEWIAFSPQPFIYRLDGGAAQRLERPFIFTIANLTQFGGGARIAPQARPDDGHLELVTISKRDAPRVMANASRLFDGKLDHVPEVQTRRFQRLKVERARPGAVQMDGELIEGVQDVVVQVRPAALTVLVPGARDRE